MAIASPLNIGNSTNSLRSVGGAVSGANRTIKNIGGILFRRTKFKRESIATSKTLTNRRIENEDRADRETELEAPNLTKTPTGASNLANQSGGSFLDRIIGFLGYTTAGWILNNLPTWIGLGKEFIARLQKAGQIISSVASDAINIVGGFGNVLGAVGKDILSFDIFDSSKRIQNAVGDLNAAFEDMGKQFNDGFKLVSTPLTDKSGKGTYSEANIPPTGTPSPNQGAYPKTPMPSGGGGGFGGGGNANQLAASVAKRLMSDFGLTDYQAAGAVGNLLNEGMAYGTGNIIQGGKRGAPRYNASITEGYGWAQWTNTEGGGPRDRLNRALIYLGMKDNPRPWSNDDNYKVLKWELQNDKKYVINNLKKAKSVDEAAMIWLTKFEGINDGTGPRRIASAKQVLPKIAQASFTSSTKQAQVSSTPGSNASIKPQNKGNLLSEYITGDPNTPLGRYDKSGHGTTRNYHDHLAFKDKETTLKAYNFFKSKGFTVTELNVSTGHVNGSLHYVGRAFDIPGAQWKGSGAIGPKEYQGSAKVRATLAQFLGTSPSLGSSSNPAAQVASTPSPEMAPLLTPERTGQDILVFDTGAGQSSPPAAPSGGGGGAPIAPDDSTMVNNFIKKKLLLDLVYL